MDSDINKIIIENGGDIGEGEIFKRCVGYPKYYISIKGRIFSTFHNIFLKPAVDGKLVDGKRNGYLFVYIQNEKGKVECRYIHRLVAEAFLENLQKYRDVHHIDKNKHNNNLSNLKWCSRKENLKDAVCVALRVTHVESGQVYKFDSITDTAEELNLSYHKIYKRIDKNVELSGFIFSRVENKAA